MKLKATMLRLSLFDFNNAYVFIKETIEITEQNKQTHHFEQLIRQIKLYHSRIVPLLLVLPQK